MEEKTNQKQQISHWDAAQKVQRGNPARLLKAINPNEAQLLEAAANVHLRFRLGGENFPPNIYYKVFMHGSLVDVNSYAPRDYSVIKRPKNPHSHPDKKKVTYEEYKQNKDQYQDEGWYLRIDNNGWRPISHKVLNKTDYVELFSANKIKYYHFKKDKRVEKTLKKKRLNKLRWLQNMYKNARKEEEEIQKQQGGDNVQKEGGSIEKHQAKQNQEGYEDDEYDEQEEQDEFIDLPQDYNPLKDQKFVDMDEDEFETEVKDLIEWSKNLDYDEYVKEWFHLSTSNASETFIPQSLSRSINSTLLSKNQQQQQIINNTSNINVNNKTSNINQTLKSNLEQQQSFKQYNDKNTQQYK